MLKYLIQITQDLFVPCVIAGLMYAYIRCTEKCGKMILNVGMAFTVLFSAVVAYYRQTTNKINIEQWNAYFIGISLVSLLVFYIFSLPFMQKTTKKAGGYITCISAAAVLFAVFAEFLPTVILYPWGFIQAGESIMSTDFILKSIGLIFGLIIMLIITLAVNRGAGASSGKTRSAVLKAVLFINAARQFGRLMSLLKLRVRSGFIKGPAAVTVSNITGTKFARAYTQFVSNKSAVFIYAVMAVMLIVPLTIWISSFKVNEPYDNPAQHRKIRAKWRDRRRWASAAAICCLLSVLNLTAVKAFSERKPEVKPVEECEIRDDSMYVSFEQVADGHLHRFAYTSENGVEIRFIVIKKPNSSAYGVGLDACEICGKAGYYERGDQVVCSRCDVVMNINTIGFKGGCNPIPIEYKVEKGNIIVPIAGLLEHEKEFK